MQKNPFTITTKNCINTIALILYITAITFSTIVVVFIKKFVVLYFTIMLAVAISNAILTAVYTFFILNKNKHENIIAVILICNLMHLLVLIMTIQDTGIIYQNTLTEATYLDFSIIFIYSLTSLYLASIFVQNRHYRNLAIVEMQRGIFNLTLEKKVNAERFNLLRSFSHELKTPITVINLAIQNLLFDKDKTNLDESTHKRYMKIRAASKRMNDLLEIHMARCCPDAEVLEFNAHHCNVNILLTNIADDLQGAELHSVELSTGKLPDNFDCDGQLVCILVRNLVTNAYHHGDPNKPIQLEIFGTRTKDTLHNSPVCVLEVSLA